MGSKRNDIKIEKWENELNELVLLQIKYANIPLTSCHHDNAWRHCRSPKPGSGSEKHRSALGVGILSGQRAKAENGRRTFDFRYSLDANKCQQFVEDTDGGATDRWEILAVVIVIGNWRDIMFVMRSGLWQEWTALWRESRSVARAAETANYDNFFVRPEQRIGTHSGRHADTLPASKFSRSALDNEQSVCVDKRKRNRGWRLVVWVCVWWESGRNQRRGDVGKNSLVP